MNKTVEKYIRVGKANPLLVLGLLPLISIVLFIFFGLLYAIFTSWGIFFIAVGVVLIVFAVYCGGEFAVKLDRDDDETIS